LGTIENRAGWILIGGKSSRMGTDKALMEVNGQKLALRMAGELGKACQSVGVVGDPLRYQGLALPVGADNFPGEGALSGIAAALAATGVDWNLIVACDMPELRAETVEPLFAADGDCNIPIMQDGRTQPLCAVYHRRVHAAIRAMLDAGVRRVIDVPGNLEKLGFAVRYVRMDSDAPFANLNTPEDVRRYLGG